MSSKLVQSILAGLALALTGTLTFASEHWRNVLPTVDAEALLDPSEVLVVDVRSPLEYERVHLEHAHNVPWGGRGFLKGLQALLEDNGYGLGKERPRVVFYDNGPPETRARQAAARAAQKGIAPVAVYEAGLYDWVSRHPRRTAFAKGEPRNDWGEETQRWLQTHGLDLDTFVRRARQDGFLIDLRERRLRQGVDLLHGKACRAPVDRPERLERCLAQARASGEIPYFYDLSGKQTPFIRHLIARHGIREYFVLEAGMAGYFARLKEENDRRWDTRRLSLTEPPAAAR